MFIFPAKMVVLFISILCNTHSRADTKWDTLPFVFLYNCWEFVVIHKIDNFSFGRNKVIFNVIISKGLKWKLDEIVRVSYLTYNKLVSSKVALVSLNIHNGHRTQNPSHAQELTIILSLSSPHRSINKCSVKMAIFIAARSSANQDRHNRYIQSNYKWLTVLFKFLYTHVKKKGELRINR